MLNADDLRFPLFCRHEFIHNLPLWKRVIREGFGIEIFYKPPGNQRLERWH